MKVILSPAKKMISADDDFTAEGKPVYLKKALHLREYLEQMTPQERKELWNCSDKLAAACEYTFQHTDPACGISPAVFFYSGLAYQHLAASVMTYDELDWLREHLRILSGFYGILRPFDGITEYRLEMQAGIRFGEYTSLYEYWGDDLYRALKDHCIVDLASKEYSAAVRPYITAADRYIEIIFGEEKNGKVIQKGTYAKALRGAMVRWMAENGTEEPEDLKNFDRGAYYAPEYSGDIVYVFLYGKQR